MAVGWWSNHRWEASLFILAQKWAGPLLSEWGEGLRASEGPTTRSLRRLNNRKDAKSAAKTKARPHSGKLHPINCALALGCLEIKLRYPRAVATPTAGKTDREQTAVNTNASFYPASNSPEAKRVGKNGRQQPEAPKRA